VAYIIGLIIVGLFFLALHYFTEFSRQQKVIVTTLVLGVVLFAIAFNTYSNSQRDKMLDAVLKFNQHKTITCKGVSVNDENFTLSIGTYTFIGKENTPYFSQMISASTCE